MTYKLGKMYALDPRILAALHVKIRQPGVKNLLTGFLENCRNVLVTSGIASNLMTQKKDLHFSDITIPYQTTFPTSIVSQSFLF